MISKLGVVALVSIFSLSGCATFEGYPGGASGNRGSLQRQEPLFYNNTFAKIENIKHKK